MNTNDELKVLKAAKIAKSSLNAAEAALRAQHQALLKEQKEITLSWASEAEVIENLHRKVDEQAADWARKHGRGIVRDLSPHEEWSPGTTKSKTVQPKLPNFGDLGSPVHFDDLCGLAPGLVKERLTVVIRESGARFGLSAEARAKRLAEISAELLGIEGRHEELLAGAAEVGISYPLLETVQKRRDAEALAKQRAAELAADRASGIFSAVGVMAARA